MGASKEQKGYKDTGKRAKARGVEQAVYNEVAATQVIAVGQKAAFEETRQAELMASRAIAVAAAGGIAQDIDHLIADIYGEGAYAASLALHAAETEAERLKFEGKQAEQYGIDQEKTYRDMGKAALLKGLGSAFGTMSAGS